MARKKSHEEHANHEAWAIPYGDLVTLMFAFFVVMYAVSSVNEGKYRVLADALAEAFGGPPKSMKPLQVGRPQLGSAPSDSARALPGSGQPRVPPVLGGRIRAPLAQRTAGDAARERERAKLETIADSVQKAMGDLIDRKLIVVRRTEMWVEIEIRADILFDSGSAKMAAAAVPVLAELADILAPYPNRLRIEGHTDNVPIATWQFPSNWELSAARAASVLHIMTSQGLDPKRLSVLGLGEQQPKADNATHEGRNVNRRVVLVLLAESADSAAATVAEGKERTP